MPRAPSTGFLMRADGALRAVVPDPYDKAIDGRGARYLVTDACVLVVGCEHCDAEAGKPCRTLSGAASASVHVARKDAAKLWKRRWKRTWTELLEHAAVSVRVSLDLLRELHAGECATCQGTGARLNQSGYRESCEQCDGTGDAPKEEPECPSERCVLCTGEACAQCPYPSHDNPCEHDVIERHGGLPSSRGRER